MTEPTGPAGLTGPVALGQLREGQIRELSRDELGALLDSAQL